MPSGRTGTGAADGASARFVLNIYEKYEYEKSAPEAIDEPLTLSLEYRGEDEKGKGTADGARPRLVFAAPPPAKTATR